MCEYCIHMHAYVDSDRASHHIAVCRFRFSGFCFEKFLALREFEARTEGRKGPAPQGFEEGHEEAPGNQAFRVASHAAVGMLLVQYLCLLAFAFRQWWPPVTGACRHSKVIAASLLATSCRCCGDLKRVGR